MEDIVEREHILQLVDSTLQNLAEVSENAAKFLRSMCQLRDLVSRWLSTSPVEERQHARAMREAWKNNEFSKNKIEVLQKSFDIPRTNMGVQFAAKSLLINKHDVKIKKLKEKHEEELKKIGQISQQAIMTTTEATSFQKEALHTEIRFASETYNATLIRNLIEEKELRTERFELEKKLASCLKKYDDDIGEKQELYDKLMLEYEKQKDELRRLQDRFDKQDTHYKYLLEEKERMEQEERQEKIFMFVCNRSARLIQGLWRAFKLRKAKHKTRKRRK